MTFTVTGVPKPLKRHRHTRYGHTYDPSAKDKQDFYYQVAKYKPIVPYCFEIRLQLFFWMPRPKHHYRTGKYSHLLKTNAPKYHSYKPDISNLVKFVEDALAGKNGFFVDDSQIVELGAVKIYETPNISPCTEIIIREV